MLLNYNIFLSLYNKNLEIIDLPPKLQFERLFISQEDDASNLTGDFVSELLSVLRNGADTEL